MDNWHSEWVVEGPDFDTSQNSPQFPTVQWSEGEEYITADSPNLSRYSNESVVGEKDICKKNDSPVKASFKNVTLAKKRLQAYTKQTNKSTAKDEKRDSEDKPEKHVARKSKKALYPDEKAKMVIQEIEVIKKKEVEENLKKQQLFAEAFRSLTSVTLRPRSRSLSSERTKHFKKREIKSRNYRRTDSIGRKSVSPDDQTRRSGRRSSPSHKKSVYPKNWTEYKQQKLTITKDETLKKKCFPSHSNSSIELYNKIYNFCVPSPPIEPFRCATEHGEKLIPTRFVRFTKSKPPIIFSVNFEAIKESYMSRKQLFQTIPKEREATIMKLIDNPSKAHPSNKRNRSQPWYHKSWKKSGEPECRVLENSVGLSFLQNYSDEEEENETEEIVICSSVKKKDQNETVSTTNDKNKKTKEVVSFPEKSLDYVKKQTPDSEVAALLENQQITQVEDQNEGRLTPIKLERDFKPAEKNEQVEEKNANNHEKIEFEERLTPIKFDLKFQIGKKNERDLEKEADNEFKTKIELAVDNTDRLTPEKASYYNEMIDYSPDRLTPEELPKYDKSGLDEFNITKSAIEELQKELKKRENLKEENRVKAKNKKKKAGMKRKMESTDLEDELPKAKKRKKKNKQKRKVTEEEEESMSSEDEKRKNKEKKESKRKKEKSKKKKNKYKKNKTREAKTKKKKAPTEEKTKKEKSTKKKNETSEDLTFSDESKKKQKKKDKKKKKKDLSVSQDTSISKEKKITYDVSVQDQVKKIPEKKKDNDWEDEELLTNTFQMLEKEKNEKINSSKSSHYEIVEKSETKLKDHKLEKIEKDKKTRKEKQRRKRSKESNMDVMSESEAIKGVEESRNSDLNRSRERGILDHSSGGRSKERKSVREKKHSEEYSDSEIESSRKPSKSKERHRNQKEGKSKRIEDVRPPLFIKQEPDWEETNSFVKKQSKRKGDSLITNNQEDFPLAKEALGVSKDLDTPDTDEYRGNWEKDPFPVWESEDESVPKVKEKINTSWESDEEVYERARVIDKPLDFTDGLDLEIPLNIKPFKRREVIDADKELQLLKIESQTLSEERIQLELEKIKVKQLELSVIKEVESKEKEQPQKRRKSVEETTREVEDKAKRRRWDRREAEPSRKPPENIVVIDLSESTSSVNTSAVLENEYEEFIKAVTSKPCHEDARKFNDSVISLSSFSDFSDSNCSFDNAFGKKFIDVQPLKMSTPIKNDLPRISGAPVSQIIIAPKDIPFIPMPGEVKPMPVPVPLINAIASPGVLSLPAQIITSIVETSCNNISEQLNTDDLILQESEEGVEKHVTHTLPEHPAKNKEEIVSSSIQENKPDVVENKLSENVVESTNNLIDVTIDVSHEEKPSSSVMQNTPGKPFSFTSLVLPTKKLLIDNSRLNLGDSDDESKKPMKAIDEIRMENLIQWNKLEEPNEELKEKLKQKTEAKQTKLESMQETKQEAKRETNEEAKRETNEEAKRGTNEEAKRETKQEAKHETKHETKQQESKEEAKQVLKGKVQEVKQDIKKLEDGEKSMKAGNRDRKQSRSRSPKSGGHHGRDKAERRGVSPKRSSDSSRYRRRDSSPKRRGRSPKKHSSPAHSPARRNSSPGIRRRYSSRRSTSPIHRRRSPSPRRKSPKRPTSPKTSSSKSRNVRSKSPQKPESTVKSHYTSLPSEKLLLETNTQKPSAIIASPLEELKKSVADSTISDDSLLPQPNLEELTESPVSHFYGRPKTEMSRQLSVNEGVRQILGYAKEDFRPISTPKPDMSKQLLMKEGVRQILGYAKEDLRPISTTYDNHGYDQNQLSQILKTIGQFSMSTKNEASTSSKSESSQENIFRNIAAVSVNIDVPITKGYKNVPTSQNSFVQVGNMVQIVPSDFNIKTENVQTVISNRHAVPENKFLQQEKKARIVQVGNMLQIVPNDSPPEPILPPLPVLPPLPPEPKKEPMETLKVAAKVITEQEKRSAEMAMKQKVAEQREERERRRLEREARRKEKEKRRREKEKHRQVKMKQKTENMIKRALQLEVEGEDGANSLLNETPTQWPPLPSISSSKDANKSILVLGHRKSVKLDRRKMVQFADGVRPGEGTSPSAGEELSSSPRYRKLPKEKRYTKTKMRMKDKKKKIKVKIIKPITDMEESDEDDHLPPPSPPPGSPPPHIFPPRVKTHPVNNIHPYVANLIPAAQSSQSPVLYRPSMNVLLPPLPPTHHHLPPPLPLPMPPHHLSGRPPEPPMMHHGSIPGMSQLHVPPPPPPPPTLQTAGGTHRSLSYHY